MSASEDISAEEASQAPLGPVDELAVADGVITRGNFNGDLFWSRFGIVPLPRKGRNIHWLDDEPAQLYIIRNPDLHAVKIGVTKRSTRVYSLVRHGWDVHCLLSFHTARSALLVERMALRVLKAYGVPSGATRDHMRATGGHTEAFDASALSCPQLCDIACESVRRTGTVAHSHEHLDEDWNLVPQDVPSPRAYPRTSAIPGLS